MMREMAQGWWRGRTLTGLAGLLASLLVLLVGCKDNQPLEKYVPIEPDGAVSFASCVDDDGDGFGEFCDRGRDCDDTDPEVTDLCFRCGDRPIEKCPCRIGTEPVACVPPPYRGTDSNGVVGTYRCSDGTRYCAAEIWGPCQALTAYVFSAD